MKKGLGLLAVSGLIFSMAACNNNGGAEKMKVGLLALHDESSTYDKNFIDAFKAACTKMDVEAIIKTNVPESEAAYTKGTELVEEGCKFIFADSFGHESHVLRAAKENPDVQFSHATGTQAHTEKVSNFHNAFASIYEGRYIAGVAAGLKLQAMLKADPNTSKTIGYVGAWPYAEVISGYTSYFLGVKSIVSDVTMKVKYTSSWYDETAEAAVAKDLIENQHCSIISQHADSWGAPNTCETAKVPNVTYNGSTESKCPNTYLISSKVNWEPYFEYAIGQVKESKTIDTDWTGALGDNLEDGSVALSPVGKKAAVEGTTTKLNEVADKLRNGTLKVFDTSKFTVSADKNPNKTLDLDENGHLKTYMADVDTDAAYTPDTQVIKKENGVSYFAESEFRSAPYFDIIIDGIDVLNS